MIRIWLEEFNYAGSGDGPPDVKVELGDEAHAIEVRFPLDSGEAEDVRLARLAPHLRRRVEDLERILRAWLGDARDVLDEYEDDGELVIAMRTALVNLEALALPEPINIEARPEPGIPDFARRLTALEARELAAALRFYADELDVAQGRRR